MTTAPNIRIHTPHNRLRFRPAIIDIQHAPRTPNKKPPIFDYNQIDRVIRLVARHTPSLKPPSSSSAHSIHNKCGVFVARECVFFCWCVILGCCRKRAKRGTNMSSWRIRRARGGHQIANNHLSTPARGYSGCVFFFLLVFGSSL